MKRLIVLLSLAAVVALTIVVVRSAWLADVIKNRIVTEIEQATGARANIGSFAFSWFNFTATIDGLTLHGSEPPHGPPLFHAQQIRIRLQPHRLLSGTLRVAQLTVDAPSFYLLQRPDGSTNLPALQSGRRKDLADLIRLRMGRVQVSRGVLRLNDLRIPISFDANGIDLLAQYRRRTRQYDLSLVFAEIAPIIQRRPQPAVSIKLAGQLSERQFAIQHLRLRMGSSSIAASGVVREFARPTIDLKTSASVDALDVAQAAGLSWLKSGLVELTGSLHYDPVANLSFTGSASGDRVTYDNAGVRVAHGAFQAHVLATPGVIVLSQLKASGLGGAAQGELRFENLREMIFRGTVEALDARSVLQLVIAKPLPFTAAVSGPVTLNTHLGQTLTDTVIAADVNLAAAAGGPSGHVSLHYHQDGGKVEFDPSEVDFAKSVVHFGGQLNNALKLDATTASLADVQPMLDWLGVDVPLAIRLDGRQSQAVLQGEIDGSLENPSLMGTLRAHDFSAYGKHWDTASADLSASASQLEVHHLSLMSKTDTVQAGGSASLQHWRVNDASRLSVQGSLRSGDFASLARSVTARAGILKGGAGSLSAKLSGTIHSLSGSTNLAVKDLQVYDQPLTLLQAAVTFSGDRAVVNAAQVRSGGALTTFEAQYQHAPSSWANGRLSVRADSNRFDLATIGALRHRIDGLSAQAEVHASGDFELRGQHVEPLSVNGTLSLRDIALGSLRRGDLTVDAGTQGDLLTMGLAGNIEGSPLLGNLRAHLAGDDSASGELSFGKLSLATIEALLPPHQLPPNWDGSFSGDWAFAGPLRKPGAITSKLVINTARLQSSAPLPGGLPADQFVIVNAQPVLIETSGSQVYIQQLNLATRDTKLTVVGSVDLASRALDLEASGTADLRLVELLNPGLQTSGTATLSVAIGGVPDRPRVRGSVKVSDAALTLPDFSNALTGINGTLHFDRNRAVIDSLSGQTGGGKVLLTGVASFGGPEPVSYNLEALASRVRFRYLRASVTGDAALRMTGTTQNGLIAGEVTISRVVLEPNLDLANMFANAAIPSATPANQQDFLTGLGVDIHIQSEPDLQVVTSLSQDVQANIDLHLRGTREHPIVLGQISANQGEVNVFGTRYTISRGSVSFINPVRIDPVLDLDLQTETRGITVDVIVTGTLNKVSMNYRSDPPLQAKEILALLTVGQAPTFAPESSNSRIQTDTSALQAGATSVLGQAISPASNRLSRLFGVTNVKIDPFIQNAYNNRQARLTLEQQVSRNITVTYVTNLAQTSEQIFRFEWSFNPQYSLVAVRDDNGEFGIDIQYKKRFK